MNKKKVYPQWFLILPLVLYIVFFLFPGLLGVFYSFTDWGRATPKNGLHFVGLKNYIDIFTSNKNYSNGIWNTLKFTLVSNVVKIIPALFLAIILFEGIRGMGAYRTVFYLPSIIPFVIIGIIFTSVLNFKNGMLNGALQVVEGFFPEPKIHHPRMHRVWDTFRTDFLIAITMLIFRANSMSGAMGMLGRIVTDWNSAPLDTGFTVLQAIVLSICIIILFTFEVIHERKMSVTELTRGFPPETFVRRSVPKNFSSSSKHCNSGEKALPRNFPRLQAIF